MKTKALSVAVFVLVGVTFLWPVVVIAYAGVMKAIALLSVGAPS